MKYGCIGERLTHSFSREIHGMLADYPYEMREIPRDGLDAFMREKAFSAINVTIPYKQAVIPYLHYVSPQAEAIHAVNTIVNRNGELYGYNTDYFGLTSLLRKIGLSPQGKKVLILGTGGTSLTARAVAKDAQARTVLRVSRTPSEADTVSYQEAANAHGDAQIIINTTPCGMFPALDGMPIHLDGFPRLEGVADAVYNPLRSRLVLAARQRGLPAEGGLYMLVAQAAAAVELFLDATLPKDSTDQVFRTISRQKENIVLTGMPGSGKTTVGQLVAQALGRPFIDMDDAIVKAAGCTIADYFARHGEDAFRDLESQIARQTVAPQTGVVIATGGGAILRDENVTALKSNGRLYFIDRPLSQLCPTHDRPTADTQAAMAARFAERYTRYGDTCDVVVSSDGVAEHVAAKILEEFSQ